MNLEFRLVLPRPEAAATEKYHSQSTVVLLIKLNVTRQTRPTFSLCGSRQCRSSKINSCALE